jgi:hypothetical protein
MASPRAFFWTLFAVFAGCALLLDGHEGLFALSTPLEPVKVAVWTAFLLFLAYTIYCSSRENLVVSVRGIAQLHWGRQIGADLYLGLCLSLFVVYLNEGSVAVALLWALPALVFVNLAMLLYFAIHFDSIVARFLA